MTVSDMHNAFRLHLDKSTSLVGSVDFLPEEIDFWLNEAQDRYIKQRLSGNNYTRSKFDQNQKSVEDLRNLISTKQSLSLSSSYLGSNVKKVSLPITDSLYPYFYYLDAALKDISGNVLNTDHVLKTEELSLYTKDSVNNPYLRRPLVYFYNDTGNPSVAFIYGDEFIPITCDLTYVKKPMKLTINTPGTYETNTCELSEHTHREIVVLAVSLVIENIESQRVQTFDQLNTSKSE